MSEAEAVSQLDRSLRALGAGIIAEGSGYAIVPEAQARRARELPGGAGGAVIYQARHVPVSELARILEPVAAGGGSVRADAGREQLYISGDPETVTALLRMARAIDVDFMQGRSFQFFPVRHTSPRQLASELRQILGGADGPLSGQIQLLEMERQGGLLVIARSPAGLDQVGVWIARLDQYPTSSSRRLRSIPVAHLRADELVETLSALVGETGVGSDAASPQTGEGARTAQAPATASGGLRITADPRSNSLIMMADEGEYRSVLEVVRELDRPPAQVLIEATIVEVTLNERLRFGVQWFFDNEGRYSGGLSATDDNAAASLYPGFSIRYAGGDVRAVLNALSAVTDVQLISTPRILVLSNESAELQVGDQVPVITQSATGLQDDSRIINSVQYRDTGVVLSVTPRVSENGRMFIEISQEVSEVSTTSSSNIDSPTIQQRRLNTRVQVDDGQLLVLGGLLRSVVSRSDSGIPYLSRAPGIGALFRTQDRNERQTELVMFLRPTVLRDRQQIDAISEEFVNRFEALGFSRDDAP
jgi:general secretion pathway protein D